MLEALFSALSGLRVSARKIQNSANNIANIQTPGFKKSRVDVGEARSGGARVTAISRVNTPGSILTTSNPVDIGIGGNGFFQVALPNGGTGFTRAGNFKIDGQGRLVTPNGNPLNPEITIPPGSSAIAIGQTGEVSVRNGGQVVNLGQIQLANFNNPSGLTSSGGNIFLQSGASGPPVTGTPGSGTFGSLIPGGVETSNVDIAGEMVDQIIAKAAFRANINVIRTVDEMTGSILDITG